MDEPASGGRNDRVRTAAMTERDEEVQSTWRWPRRRTGSTTCFHAPLDVLPGEPVYLVLAPSEPPANEQIDGHDDRQGPR